MVISIAEARKSLSTLIKRAAAGEKIEIGAYGQSQVVLGPSTIREGAVRFGTLAGRLTVPDDFDAPLPDPILDEFEHFALPSCHIRIAIRSVEC